MILHGVDVKDLNELRKNIVLHFGSISAFSQSTGYSYRILKRVLLELNYVEEEYKDIKAVYDKNFDPDYVPFRISKDDSESIRVAIFSNFKKVIFFCKKHPEYNSVYISNIINGKLKLRSGKFRALEKLLQKRYNLK